MIQSIGSRVELIGERVSAMISWTGGMSRMFGQAVRRGPKPPIGVADIAYQLVQLGVRSIPLSSLMAGFVGMILAWQFGEALADFGAKSALGNASSLALVRELVPAIIAVTVGAKMATGMTAELGSMKVTEQIDAIAALGADPIKKLVWPRLVAATIAMPLLVAWGNLLAILGGMFISDTVFDVPATYFYASYIEELEPMHYICGLVKALTFGMLAGIIGCFQGFRTSYGTEAVGLATNETVVAMSVLTLITDFALTTIFLPDLTMAMIELSGVDKAFGPNIVYRDMSLEIRQGETMAILGGSGSGKSVCLKLIIGLLAADRGRIAFAGDVVGDMNFDQLRKLRRRVSMVFQGGALFDSMSVAENVAYGLREHTDSSEQQIHDRVSECLAAVGLGVDENPEIFDTMPVGLSGGMRKRVALARSIALRPEVILYDEPTTGLDPSNCSRIAHMIRQLQKELGVTSIVVTHDMATAWHVADRVAMLHDRCFRWVCPIQEFRTIDDPIVRDFVEGRTGQ